MADNTLQDRAPPSGNARQFRANALSSLDFGLLPPPLKRPIVSSGAHHTNKESPQSECLLAGMMVKEFHVPAGISAACAALALIASGVLAPAFAQQPPSPPPAPVTPEAPAGDTLSAMRYIDLASDQSFVLEERGRSALLQLEGTGEVIPLQAVPAQRGDTFLRTQSGQSLLRKTEAGNMVSYIGNKNGVPADIAGRAAPLNAPPMPASLNELRTESAFRLSRMAGHDVTIFGTAEFSDYEEWAADALNNVEIGVDSANGVAGLAASKLTAVRLIRADAPSVSFKDGELVLGVNPEQGYLGRVSSDAIASALTASRSAG